jgi:hypothetical protein
VVVKLAQEIRIDEFDRRFIKALRKATMERIGRKSRVKTLLSAFTIIAIIAIIGAIGFAFGIYILPQIL